MTIQEFKEFVKTGKHLDTAEIHRLMDEESDAARRITFQCYHPARGDHRG